MDRAEIVGVFLVVVGVCVLAWAAEGWFGREAALVVVGVSAVLAGVVVTVAAARADRGAP
jgi:multisubunit Na+/H+ antiporter MnhG subunit